MTYALGRRIEYYDMPAVRAIALEAAHNGNRVSSFIFGIVTQRGVPDEEVGKHRTDHGGGRIGSALEYEPAPEGLKRM